MISVTVGDVYTSLTTALPGFPGTVIKSTLLLGLVLGIAGLMRRTPASARHLVWSMGILGALLIPVLSQTIPWQLPVLPAAPRQTVTALPSSTATVFLGVLEPVSSTDSKAEVGGAATTSASGTKAGVFFGATGEEAQATPQSTSLWNTHAIVRAVVVVWLAGAVGLIGWILLGMFLVGRIVRHGTPLRDYRWVQLLGAVSEDMGVVAPVRLVRSNALTMPVTSGVVRPVVILPEGSEEWGEDRRRAVLLHELAHVRRHDLVWHILARVACALYWFHPLVWYAARKLRAESERACDDLVLNAGTQASDYADHLLQIVRSAGSSRTPATAVPMAQRSEFEGRLLAILDSGVKRHGLTLARGFGIVLAVAISTIPLAALGRAPQVPAEPEPAVSLVDPTSNAVDSTPVAVLPAPELDSPVELEMTTVDRSSDLSPEAAPERKVKQEEQSSAQQTEAGVDPVAALIVALDDPDRGVRMAALEALARMDDSRALPGATQALGSEDPAMRVAALQLLSHMGDPRALPATLPLLEDPDRRVRAAAAEAVGEFQDSTAINALSRALRNDTDPEVRKTAAWALGEIADSRALPALMAALSGDTSAEVRGTAAWALGEIEDPSALDALGSAVRDENTQVRRQAIEAIGEIDDRRAVPVLIPLLDDADPEVRKLAVWALGELEDPASVDALGKATLDANTEVRRTAVRALGEVEDPRALDYLIVTLRDSDAEVRAYSAWALGEIEDARALDALVAALSDENAEVRSQAVHALGHLEDPRAEAGLSMALTDERVDVRVQAANALGELDLSVAPPALIAAMNDASPQVRKVAAHSLGEIGDPAATDVLAAGVNDQNRDVRLTSLQALGEMGTQRSLEILVQSMSSEDPEVRRVAARMLGRRGDR